METIFLVLSFLITLVLGLVIWKPAKIYEYPYFMTAVIAVFILPQAYALMKFPGGATEQSIFEILLISVLTIPACFAGYYFLKPNPMLGSFMIRPINFDRLLHVGTVYSIIGLGAGVLMPVNRISFAESGGLTGILTIYLFFANLSHIGFAICLYCLLKKITLTRCIIVLFSALNPIATLLLGRREPAAMFVITLALCYYFYKKKKPSRLLVFGVLILALLAIPVTGTYRGLLQEGKLTDIKDISIIGNFKDFVKKGTFLELRNGAVLIEMAHKQGIEYGTGYWNHIVHRYVPAQLLSKDFKNALLIGTTVDTIFTNQLPRDYDSPLGLTVTGMADSFQQLGWLGSLFFILLGIIYRNLWWTANNLNSPQAQIIYMLTICSAMRSITHQTVDYFPGAVYYVIFFAFAWLYASEKVIYRQYNRSKYAKNKSAKITPPSS